MGGKWQVQGVQKDGQGIAGYWRNGWPRNGVLEDMATHWGWPSWHWRCSCGHKWYLEGRYELGVMRGEREHRRAAGGGWLNSREGISVPEQQLPGTEGNPPGTGAEGRAGGCRPGRGAVRRRARRRPRPGGRAAEGEPAPGPPCTATAPASLPAAAPSLRRGRTGRTGAAPSQPGGCGTGPGRSGPAVPQSPGGPGTGAGIGPPSLPGPPAYITGRRPRSGGMRHAGRDAEMDAGDAGCGEGCR